MEIHGRNTLDKEGILGDALLEVLCLTNDVWRLFVINLYSCSICWRYLCSRALFCFWALVLRSFLLLVYFCISVFAVLRKDLYILGWGSLDFCFGRTSMFLSVVTFLPFVVGSFFFKEGFFNRIIGGFFGSDSLRLLTLGVAPLISLSCLTNRLFTWKGERKYTSLHFTLYYKRDLPAHSKGLSRSAPLSIWLYVWSEPQRTMKHWSQQQDRFYKANKLPKKRNDLIGADNKTSLRVYSPRHALSK